MNELPRVPELEDYQSRQAQRVGVEAVERELIGSAPVDIALYVNGRMITTKTDVATLQRIMALLTGLEQ